MKNDDDRSQESPQISIIDFIEKISNTRQKQKTVSSSIRLHSYGKKSNPTIENKNTIQCALNYANSLDW